MVIYSSCARIVVVSPDFIELAEYNATATAAAARNQTTDGATLVAKLDDLVQTTRNTITAQLSAQGVSRLQSFVVAEKKNMKVQGE